MRLVGLARPRVAAWWQMATLGSGKLQEPAGSATTVGQRRACGPELPGASYPTKAVISSAMRRREADWPESCWAAALDSSAKAEVS